MRKWRCNGNTSFVGSDYEEIIEAKTRKQAQAECDSMVSDYYSVESYVEEIDDDDEE